MNQLEQSAIQDRIRVLQEKNPFIPMHQIIYCILSSKNPWFCQSKFLGIATGIPW